MDTALKEWSVAVSALGLGVQTILLRKGGIIEAERGGFELRHPEFLFFPTYEHQHKELIREEFHSLWQPPEPGRLRIGYGARATAIYAAPETPEGMLAASGHFLWNERFVRQRYAYRPELPLYVVEVRVFRLLETYEIADRPSYVGCKSWVNLTEDLPVAGWTPVLSDADYDSRTGALRAGLGLGR